MKNPFVEGDVIWFTNGTGPVRLYMAVDDQGLFESMISGLRFGLEEILWGERFLDGPYRVTNTEDWSNYDFKGDDE